ncbi:MAG TPA: proteasome assembly chaperone family protein [Nanoarchaeota archaeon]|nr:proteasome assembly chaperone family protein [Nanoarchaeota archaeon]
MKNLTQKQSNHDMDIVLTKKPKAPIIIEGFPGLGLISTITTEFLIKHLNAKPIGSMWSRKLVPIAAVHDAKIIQPLEIFYAEKENIVIVHALSDVRGIEWDISKAIQQLYDMLGAKELITIEGIMSKGETSDIYFYTGDAKKRKKLEDKKILPLKEGIIVGVTAGLVLKEKDMNIVGIFIETHSKLPDSMSAAKVVKVLDEYLGLNLDPKPLMEAAAQFEAKLKTLLEQTKQTMEHKQTKDEMNYMG